MHRHRAAFAAICMTFSVAARAAEPYVLEKLAEAPSKTNLTTSTLGLPALNNAGTAAYRVKGDGVFVGTPGNTQRLSTPSDLTFDTQPFNAAFVGINDSGQVAFAATPPNPNHFVGTDGVYLRDTDGTVTNLLPAFTRTDQLLNGPVINNGGVVAAGIFSSFTRGTVFTSNNSAALTARSIRTAHLDGAGQFAVVHDSGSLFYKGQDIVTQQSPTFSDPVMFINNGTFNVFDADVNASGRVAFSSTLSGPITEAALFTYQDGVINLVDGSRGVGLGTPAINDAGGIAVLITPDSAPGQVEHLSIFADGSEQRLISVGDSLFGATVTDLAFTAEGFNQAGQITFTAALSDGRDVLVVGSPVPEPTTIGILALAAPLLLRRRRPLVV